MPLPLSGVRVLDLTHMLAGPYCTLILSDLGAEVIKLEKPGSGDDSRSIGPFINGESYYFMGLNRNKKSVVLNLKEEEGRQVFLELVKQSDVLVENFRPGIMEKLGLDFEKLQEHNPGLIYAACSGFGHTGPDRNKPAYDIIIQALGGIMSITGPEGGPPTKVGTSYIADVKHKFFLSNISKI